MVHLLVGVDIVDRSITGHGSLKGHASAGVVVAIVFHDVIFNEGASSPPVDSEVSISRWLERAGKVDVSDMMHWSAFYDEKRRLTRLTGSFR